MNEAHYMEIRKHHIFTTLQEYRDMDNNPKNFFSLAIAKDLIPEAKSAIFCYYNLYTNLITYPAQSAIRLRISIIIIPNNNASYNIINK